MLQLAPDSTPTSAVWRVTYNTSTSLSTLVPLAFNGTLEIMLLFPEDPFT